MKITLPSGLTRSLNRVGLQLRKHAPEIMAAAGALGVVAGTVMACKATVKAHDVLEEAKSRIDTVHEARESTIIPEEVYTEEHAKKELTEIYLHTGVELVKLYAPAVIVTTLSITGMVASSLILRKRNIALAAAYKAIDSGFKEYRNRVVERFGEEMDRELRFDVKAEEVTTTITDENGNETEVTATVQSANHQKYSDYARCFDNGCKNWEKDAEYNLMFLRNLQEHLNQKLRANGYLFLNDLYDAIGVPRTKAGQIVGWIYDEKNPNGDNYVDLGIYNIEDEACRSFVNGFERSIWIDPNVDGPILDLI